MVCVVAEWERRPTQERRRRVESSSQQSETDFSDLLYGLEEDLNMAPTDADPATTQLSSPVPASAAVPLSASTVPASSRYLREVQIPESPRC